MEHSFEVTEEREPAVTPIRILLVDDHPIFRAGLRALLESQADVQVVGEAGDGAEAETHTFQTVGALIVLVISNGFASHRSSPTGTISSGVP